MVTISILEKQPIIKLWLMHMRPFVQQEFLELPKFNGNEAAEEPSQSLVDQNQIM
jgi:hypothetical protein